MSDPRLIPSVGVAFVGVLWGVFWIPVRFMEDNGFGGPWPCVAFFAVSIAICAPFAFPHWRAMVRNARELAIVGLLCGGTFALYITALLFTDVVHAILMFYLTPVWSTVAARIVFGASLTWTRAGVIACGFAGLYAILGAESGLPMPSRFGDWMALASGICWALGSLYLFRGVKSGFAEQLFGFAVGGLVVTLVLIPVLPGPDFFAGSYLDPERLSWKPFAAGIAMATFMMPANFVVLWAASKLEPARVGILLMMEVVVGVTTAAGWSGEPFGWREALGAGLIVAAGLIEVMQRTDPAIEARAKRSQPG
jgi:drug/metabolite transporter (DMT)-like permease